MTAIMHHASTTRPIEWLWQDRIARGALCLLGGKPGVGKSTVACDLAASVTRGTLPGDLYGSPRRVLMVISGASFDTVRPCLRVADADLTLVDYVEGLSLPSDLQRFEEMVRGQHSALVIFDPLIARRSSVPLDTHKEGEVRQALGPVVEIAEHTNAAILGLIDLAETSNWTLMTHGASAIARSVLLCSIDPHNEYQRMVTLAKSRLDVEAPGALRFTIGPKVVWFDQ